jgi:hypothetical protein
VAIRRVRTLIEKIGRDKQDVRPVDMNNDIRRVRKLIMMD